MRVHARSQSAAASCLMLSSHSLIALVPSGELKSNPEKLVLISLVLACISSRVIWEYSSSISLIFTRSLLYFLSFFASGSQIIVFIIDSITVLWLFLSRDIIWKNLQKKAFLLVFMGIIVSKIYLWNTHILSFLYY